MGNIRFGSQQPLLTSRRITATEKKTTANPIVVTVANGEKASSTHEGFIDVLGLPTTARNAHVIPGIKHSLLSIM